MAESDQSGSRLDPRIKGELDKLNSTSEEINRLEKELDDARQQFRVTLTESSYKLSEAAKRCGKAVKKGKPYHEARIKENKAHEKVQEAAYSYRRAVGMFRAAKETITIAEETSMQGNKKRDFDSALQEMLNHATVKLNDAEHAKERGQKEHQHLSKAYIKSQAKVEQLAKKLRKSIAKSAAYYDLRDAFYSRLENLKDSVENRQKLLAKCKKRYREALRNLEMISEDIHRSRQLQLEASLTMLERSSGVGAESETEPTRNTEDEDEVFQSGTAAKGDYAEASDEQASRAQNAANPDPNPVASSGPNVSRHSSSYSSSIDEGEAQSPVLTEHGLPTLTRYKMHRVGSDPDFYRPKVAIAKLPGILPEEQEVLEATIRGYRPFDADLTEEEVTALRQASTGPAGAQAPVIMVESPEGVVSDPTGDSEEEEELEVYQPEEIEMSELANGVTSGKNGKVGSGPREEDGVELRVFEQETQLNGAVESSPEISEGEKDDDETGGDKSSSEGEKETVEQGPSPSETSESETDQEVTEDDGEIPEVRGRRVRGLSFGTEKNLLEEDNFEEVEQLLSPIKDVRVSEFERPGSPMLFQYHAEEHKSDIREADDMTVSTADETATNDNRDPSGIKND